MPFYKSGNFCTLSTHILSSFAVRLCKTPWSVICPLGMDPQLAASPEIPQIPLCLHPCTRRTIVGLQAVCIWDSDSNFQTVSPREALVPVSPGPPYTGAIPLERSYSSHESTNRVLWSWLMFLQPWGRTCRSTSCHCVLVNHLCMFFAFLKTVLHPAL